jgi:uncharacterized RDD family membrane protein YckC
VKCPKCQYIGFDNGQRCRNCGYEFSLSVEAADLDLPIQTGDEPEGPLVDLTLEDVSRPLAPTRSAVDPSGGSVQVPVADSHGAPRARRHSRSGADLPLFRDRTLDGDAPLVTPSASPRPPLAVRRATPAMPRARGGDEAQEGQHSERRRAMSARTPHAAAHLEEAGGHDAAVSEEVEVAGAGARLLAAIIDSLILGCMTFVVVHFTLQMTRLGFEDLALLPKVPLVTFLVFLNGGYLVAFVAAGGQTIGKMATGIRVVPADPVGRASQRVPLGQAVLRVAGCAVSLLPAGLGFLPALVGQQRRALHDRLADTRVIKL